MRIFALCRHGLYLLTGAALGAAMYFLMACSIGLWFGGHSISLSHIPLPVIWTSGLGAPLGAVVGSVVAEALYRR